MRALYSPEVYGSGKGVQEIAVWNLDGVDDPGRPPIWLVVLSAAIPVTLIAGLVFKETKMAAKRKRGLGGTAKQHRDRAEQYEPVARSFFRDTITQARAGNCGSAFEKYDMGRSIFSSSEQDAYDAGVGPGFSDTDTREAYRDAAEQFRKLCLVNNKRAGLSGLRRTRRKARR